MALIEDLWHGEIAPIEGDPSSDDYYVAVARRKDVQDEFATELTQEQAEHFTELMKLLWEENDYGLIEAFRQGIKFGIKLMEEINT